MNINANHNVVTAFSVNTKYTDTNDTPTRQDETYSPSLIRDLTYQSTVKSFPESTPQYTPTIQELPETLRPRERMAYAGAGALSTAELLALVLRVGGRGENAIRMAERLLTHFGGLPGLAQASIEELCQLHNVGPAKAAEIQAVVELSKRLTATAPMERPVMRSPADVANLLMLEMGLLEQEHLRIVLLDTKNRVTRINTLYIGSLNSAAIRVGEVFRDPIRTNSASIVMVHNHPSGDPSPSPEDVLMTKMAVEAGQLLDIEVLDHLIIGRNRFVSLKERGLGFGAT
ncbi:MAG: DNA repair protein RadC [Chloroflexota bacterium]